MSKPNRIFSLVFIIFGLFMFLYSNRFPEEAAFWPKVFSVVLVLLSVGLIIDTLKNPNREEVKGESPTRNEFVVLGLIVGVIVIYMLLLNIVGFFILSILLVGGLLWYLGYRKMIGVLSISIATTVLITVIFQVLLHVPIPQGVLENFF
ncbi:tripartite tricarboxylate transporter TctB family protein [Ammoniphilus sp. YIM 78166]|uniref:tripartite tricarboxylate transporter TctB family protein n=1 Tax=Ammoniphilus sp. YIM 78166 TaxID=1644106 RepID=UPI00106FA8B8|nr:tripartite tricarboxylate transporter TctB family protein [Ammoniphilus sp. YIM 78166]